MVLVNADPKNEFTQEEILSCLYDKPYICPCCDAEFFEKTVVPDKIKICGQDSDLRKYYTPVDPLLYDIVYCTSCGYASLSETFDNLPFWKARLISAEITPRHEYTLFPRIYSYEIGIIRYKSALLNALVTREKTSEIAYLYMKLAWLFRSTGDVKAELDNILASVEGFSEAMDNEYYPFIDMNEATTLYVTADFSYRLADNEKAWQLFNKALECKEITDSLKKKIKNHPLMQ